MTEFNHFYTYPPSLDLFIHVTVIICQVYADHRAVSLIRRIRVQ